MGGVGAAALTLGPLPDQLLDAASTVVAGVMDRRSVVGVRGETEQALNVLLFVPLSALSVLAWPRRSAVTVALVWTALSVGVELTQALVLTARHPSARDVALNGAGAVLGALLGAWARRASPPTSRRQLIEPPLRRRSPHPPLESTTDTTATHSKDSGTYGQPHPRSDVDPRGDR